MRRRKYARGKEKTERVERAYSCAEAEAEVVAADAGAAETEAASSGKGRKTHEFSFF